MRNGEYCISHIDVMLKEKCISERRYKELKDWGEFREVNPAIAELSEGASMVLMREKDSEIQARALKAVAKNISNGNVPTAKQAKTIVENKRADVKPGGRIQSGKDSVPEQPTLTMEDFLSVEKNEVGDVEDLEIDPEIDTQQDYYTGDGPETPTSQEGETIDEMPPNIQKKPEALKAPLNIADITEEERVTQATKDLQKEKEDERERTEIKERSESNKTKDTLVSVLSGAMRTALHEGITRKEVFEALHIAIDSVFEPIESDTERKTNGS